MYGAFVHCSDGSSQVGTQAGISEDIDDLKVTRQDFMMALDEVHPAFGVSEEELEQVIQNGIIHFDRRIEVNIFQMYLKSLAKRCQQEILKDGKLYIEQVRNSERTPCVSVCVHGLFCIKPEFVCPLKAQYNRSTRRRQDSFGSNNSYGI